MTPELMPNAARRRAEIQEARAEETQQPELTTEEVDELPVFKPVSAKPATKYRGYDL